MMLNIHHDTQPYELESSHLHPECIYPFKYKFVIDFFFNTGFVVLLPRLLVELVMCASAHELQPHALVFDLYDLLHLYSHHFVLKPFENSKTSERVDLFSQFTCKHAY
jgi:hypothetical protein